MLNSGNGCAPQPSSSGAVAVLPGLQQRRGVAGVARRAFRRSPSLPASASPAAPSSASLLAPGLLPRLSQLEAAPLSFAGGFSCRDCAHLALLPPSPRNPTLALRCAGRGRAVVTASQSVGCSSVAGLVGVRGWAGGGTARLVPPGRRMKETCPWPVFSSRCCWSAV